MNEKLYYVGIAAASAAAQELSGESVPPGVTALIHVYVKALDETYASAAASTVCSGRGLEFRAFTYLPSEETEATLQAGEEHRMAFAHASRHGLAYVMAMVFDGDHRLISTQQFD
jgi:hypothetical protein